MGFGKDHHYKIFDLGWNFLAGVEYKKLALTTDYNMGLTSITHDGYGQTPIKNRILAVTLAYYLTKKSSYK